MFVLVAFRVFGSPFQTLSMGSLFDEYIEKYQGLRKGSFWGARLELEHGEFVYLFFVFFFFLKRETMKVHPILREQGTHGEFHQRG